MRYTGIRVPKEFDESVNILRNHLLRKGIDNLPKFTKYLIDKNCSLCHLEMKRVEDVGAMLVYKCSKCGFSKPVIDIKTVDEMNKGTIVGLSVHVLSRILESQNER